MPIPLETSSTQNRVLLRDIVRAQIKEAILDGTLRPGESLHDVDLKRWLGVSRTPIRDAINELTRMGLIDMISSRHVRVSTPSEQSAIESYLSLGILLSSAIRLYLPSMSEPERAAAVSKLDDLLELTEQDDFRLIRKELVPAFEPYLNHRANNQLDQLCDGALDGLSFKIRSERLRPFINIDNLREGILKLKTATQEQCVSDAECAVSQMFSI